MFRKILIANRGEIALRVLRACRELGIRSVLAYSEADRDSLPVRLSDEAVCIGPAPAMRSYNNIPAIISAAIVTGCDALHPGYGFLAENPSLAEICHECGIAFIGPRPDVLAQMGNKAIARATMKKAGIPIMPGAEEAVHDAPAARDIAKAIGYPVLIKAVAGGGGRGMRIARDERELVRLLTVAQGEAQAAFGNGAVYVERFLDQPRHVEVQVLADEHGHVLSLGERDCSLQRRYQKLVEESPAPSLSGKTRENLARAALRGARAINYTSAGTFEFLVDRDDHFYFTEANTRIQVEHPVTEMVTGVDLVQWQIRIAGGEPLNISQKDVQPHGHAIEVRITAENPAADFSPSCGEITGLLLPGGPGVRVDTHIYPGYVVPPHYDSLLAKLIVWAPSRAEAAARLRRALAETMVSGVSTTVGFYQQLLEDEDFLRGHLTTGFVGEFLQRTALPAVVAAT
ncbi:MAG TPA: acetyl-CoA carboxylase biotin carboxylase subunit [Thermomicrobiaceae bacterium]|nr:acetyl-CoA carboxylase biotin carboxylase subunit [Thermomicrobiaceae bacterium]